MDTQLLSYTIILFLSGIFYIATTSIGLQCANSNEKYKEEYGSNFGFLISQLVSAIFVTILAIVGIYYAITAA